MMHIPIHKPRTTALLRAALGVPSHGLPALRDPAATHFWSRFDAAAPWHLRFVLTVAVVVLGSVLPRVMGHIRPLHRLNAEEADRVVTRADTLPVLRDLIRVVKLVGCMAYFDAPEAQEHVRGRAAQ